MDSKLIKEYIEAMAIEHPEAFKDIFEEISRQTYNQVINVINCQKTFIKNRKISASVIKQQTELLEKLSNQIFKTVVEMEFDITQEGSHFYQDEKKGLWALEWVAADGQSWFEGGDFSTEGEALNALPAFSQEIADNLPGPGNFTVTQY